MVSDRALEQGPRHVPSTDGARRRPAEPPALCLLLHVLVFIFFSMNPNCTRKVIGGELQERLIPVPYSKTSTDQAVRLFMGQNAVSLTSTVFMFFEFRLRFDFCVFWLFFIYFIICSNVNTVLFIYRYLYNTIRSVCFPLALGFHVRCLLVSVQRPMGLFIVTRASVQTRRCFFIWMFATSGHPQMHDRRTSCCTHSVACAVISCVTSIKG